MYIYIQRFLLIFVLASLMLLNHSAIAKTDGIRAEMIRAADNKTSGEYVRSRFLKQMKKPFERNDPRKKLLLIGDSYAQDFYNVLLEHPVSQHYQISTRYIPTICQMYLGDEDITPFREKRHQKTCETSDTLALARPQIAESDILILASNWKTWSAERLPGSIQQLALKPEQQLFIIGRKSFSKLNVRKYLRMPIEKLKSLRNPVDNSQQAINNLMQNTLDNDIFIDIQTTICRSESDCPVFTQDGHLITFDGSHFTPQGARFAGDILFTQFPLKQLVNSKN